MTTYRVGNHQPQNVYRDDQYIGVMFTPEDAALVVEALNGEQEYGPIPALRTDPVELTQEEFDKFRTAWQRALADDPTRAAAPVGPSRRRSARAASATAPGAPARATGR